MGLVLVAQVVRHGDSVKIALIVLGASLVFSLAILLTMRALRVRRERSQP